jgi:hypothetical protein
MARDLYAAKSTPTVGILRHRRSAGLSRVAGLAPRAVLLVAVAVLAVLGLRTLAAGRPAAPATPPDTAASDGAGFLAEAFTRAYLSWDPRRPDARARALAPIASSELGEGARLQPPAAGPAQRVLWTSVLGVRAGAAGEMVVRVVADTTSGLRVLDVPVLRGRDGALAVAAPPALVAAPRTDPRLALSDPQQVRDGTLAAVVRRALAHYLEGDAFELEADLAPGAVVALPPPLARVRVGEVGWLSETEGRIAVTAEASLPGGARARLRYELVVAQEGRWLVHQIAPDP